MSIYLINHSLFYTSKIVDIYYIIYVFSVDLIKFHSKLFIFVIFEVKTLHGYYSCYLLFKLNIEFCQHFKFQKS